MCRFFEHALDFLRSNKDRVVEFEVLDGLVKDFEDFTIHRRALTISIDRINIIDMATKILTAMEVRKRFGEIMNRVSLRGERFTVARAGKPLAQIIPIGVGTNDAGVDIFDMPFVTFNEWSDPSNDAYDAL